MIKCDEDFISIEGSGPTVAAELTCIIIGFREIHEKRIGKEKTEELLNQIIERSKLSAEEIDQKNAELEKALNNLLNKFLKL